MNHRLRRIAVTTLSTAALLGIAGMEASVAQADVQASNSAADCDKGGVGTHTGWASCNMEGKWTMTVWCTWGDHAESTVVDGPGSVEVDCPAVWETVNAISTT